MVNVAIIDKSYLEATGIDRILKANGCKVKSDHYLDELSFNTRSTKTDPDIILVDTETIGSGIEAFTRQAKAAFPRASIVWLMPQDDLLTQYDAISASADGCVPKTDFSAIVNAVKLAGTGTVLFNKQVLLDFARQVSVLFPRAGRQIAELTPREREVLDLIRQGATNKEIAKRLFVSVETVKVRVKNIRDKLGVVSRRQLIGGIPSRGIASDSPGSGVEAEEVPTGL